MLVAERKRDYEEESMEGYEEEGTSKEGKEERGNEDGNKSQEEERGKEQSCVVGSSDAEEGNKITSIWKIKIWKNPSITFIGIKKNGILCIELTCDLLAVRRQSEKESMENEEEEGKSQQETVGENGKIETAEMSKKKGIAC